MSTFSGQQFYTKAYKEDHPELHFQHRGKGRWYIVDSREATVPPPLQAHNKIKAAASIAKVAQSIETEDGVPQEPRIKRKRGTVIDLEDQPQLKQTRTRKGGSAPDAAIDVDDESPKEDIHTASKRRSPDGAVDPQENKSTTGPVTPKTTPPQKKTRAPRAKGMTIAYTGPQGLAESPALGGMLRSDLDAMGMSLLFADEDAADELALSSSSTSSLYESRTLANWHAGITDKAGPNRKPNPEVDSMTQRTSTLKRLADAKQLRLDAFNKKQAKRATARKGGAAKKAATNTDISVNDDGSPSNWILFDPRHGFPPVHGDPPAQFLSLTHYKPGNYRILAYNTESFSVAARRVPKTFEGCEVLYTKTGPKLVKAKAGNSIAGPSTAVAADSPTAVDSGVEVNSPDSIASEIVVAKPATTPDTIVEADSPDSIESEIVVASSVAEPNIAVEADSPRTADSENANSPKLDDSPASVSSELMVDNAPPGTMKPVTSPQSDSSETVLANAPPGTPASARAAAMNSPKPRDIPDSASSEVMLENAPPGTPDSARAAAMNSPKPQDSPDSASSEVMLENAPPGTPGSAHKMDVWIAVSSPVTDTTEV